MTRRPPTSITSSRGFDLLRVDSVGGLAAGVAVIAASGWLAALYEVPRSWVLFNGVVNLAYGSFSGMLARQSRRPSALIVLLATANIAWGLFCAGAIVWLADRASW